MKGSADRDQRPAQPDPIDEPAVEFAEDVRRNPLWKRTARVHPELARAWPWAVDREQGER